MVPNQEYKARYMAIETCNPTRLSCNRQERKGGGGRLSIPQDQMIYSINTTTAATAAQMPTLLRSVLVAAPGKGVPAVMEKPGADVVEEVPSAALLEVAIWDATGGAGAAVVELVGTAVVVELELRGTGRISTVEAAVAITVVLALLGPTMMMEGREVGTDVVVLRCSVRVRVVVEVDVVLDVDSAIAAALEVVLANVAVSVLWSVSVMTAVCVVVRKVVNPVALSPAGDDIGKGETMTVLVAATNVIGTGTTEVVTRAGQLMMDAAHSVMVTTTVL